MVTRLTIVPMKLKLYVTQAAYIAKIDSIKESKTTFHEVSSQFTFNTIQFWRRGWWNLSLTSSFISGPTRRRSVQPICTQLSILHLFSQCAATHMLKHIKSLFSLLANRSAAVGAMSGGERGWPDLLCWWDPQTHFSLLTTCFSHAD